MAIPSPEDNTQSDLRSLADAALTEILMRGAPILGLLDDCLDTSNLSDWMSAFPDGIDLVKMNLPGTHDTCTWSYTPEIQESLKRYTGPIPDSRIYRCQQRSMFKMLNDGIRVFDLRYALNSGLDTIGFYHADALLSPTTRMEDVFFGLYTWLDKHPTETLLISLNYEPAAGRSDDASIQEMLYKILNSDLAKKYWCQKNGLLGTLGEARGMLILIQRFDYNLLPGHLDKRFGIHLDPRHWTVNGEFIELIYNSNDNRIAYIQDNYRLPPSTNSNPGSCINEKFQVIVNHLERAVDSNLHPDQLYISFASAAFRVEEISLTPQVYALGDKEQELIGINERLLRWLLKNQGKRLGIIRELFQLLSKSAIRQRVNCRLVLDFYDAVPGVVEAIIGEKLLSRV